MYIKHVWYIVTVAKLFYRLKLFGMIHFGAWCGKNIFRQHLENEETRPCQLSILLSIPTITA